METFRTFLAGHKTYLTAISAIALALAGYAGGEIDLAGLITALLGALGLASLRAGITTEARRAAGQD